MSELTVNAHEQVPDGYKVVPRKPNELQIDLDSTDGFYNGVVSRHIENHLGPCEITITISKSGNRHVVFRFDEDLEISDEQAIAMQAALGSDPVREILSLIRVMEGTPDPICLYEKDDATVAA